MYYITLLLFVFHISFIYAFIGYDLQYCDDPNSIDRVEPSQDFKFEVNMDDFYSVIEGQKKSIACCAPKGSEIEWLFENRILKETETSFHVLDSDPRYIISPNVTMSATMDYGYEEKSSPEAGTYKCIVRNKKFEGALQHKFTLYVMPNNFVNKIHVMNNLYGHPISVVHGQKVTIRSSQLLGFMSENNLPNITVEWNSNSPHYNTSYLNSKEVKKTRIYVSGGSANMISLITFKADKSFLSKPIEFDCVIKYLDGTLLNKDSPEKIKMLLHRDIIEESTRVYKIIIATIITFVAISIVLIYVSIYYQIEIRLMIKDKFGKLEISDGKKHDVFVCFNFNTKASGEDQNYCMHTMFVYKMLVPHLEDTLGYSCYNYLRDTKGGEWLPGRIEQKLKSSRRLVLVLCDGFLDDPMCKLICHSAVNEALTRKLPIVCILPEKSKRKAFLAKCYQSNSAMQPILSIARKLTLPGNKPTPKQCTRFWKTLCLYMPPRRENLHLNNHQLRKNCIIQSC